MKKTRKIFAVVLALVMCLAMALPAMAASITINDTEGNTVGHVYKVYQIYTGTFYHDKEKNEDILSDVKYGQNYHPGETEVGDPVPDTELADVIEAGGDGFASSFYGETATRTYVGDPVGSIKGSGTLTDLADGYYLVVDTAAEDVDDEEFVYSNYIIQVIGGTSVNPKSDVPTSEKKVSDVNDSTGSSEALQDSADYDIGDDVPFQLKGTLPNNFDSFKTYKLVFHDKQSAGLTLNTDSVEVTIAGNIVAKDKYRIENNPSDGTCTFEIVIPEVVGLTGAANKADVIVTYTSKLTGDAVVIGGEGNPNTMHMEYSNNPTVGGEGDTGNTPDDTVVVFTYKLDISKVDEKGDSLSGAEFTLEKYNESTKSWGFIEKVAGTEGTVFNFKGLDDGYYRLKETKTPDGYNSIEDIYFEVTAEHVKEADKATLETLGVVQHGIGADGNSIGDPLEGSAATFKVTISKEEGSIASDITNKKGSLLPSTGGIGTTIFYVVGICLVVGAVVILVTRKRVGKNS